MSMLYRKEMTHDGPVWKNYGVSQARACQGHSIPWIVPERLGVFIEANRVSELPCLSHGTTFDAFASILKGSLKPASHVDPVDYRRPGSRSQRPATGGVGAGGYTLVRNVLMMSPYPYCDRQRYVGGARKDSDLYIFLQKENVAELVATTTRRLDLTPLQLHVTIGHVLAFKHSLRLVTFPGAITTV